MFPIPRCPELAMLSMDDDNPSWQDDIKLFWWSKLVMTSTLLSIKRWEFSKFTQTKFLFFFCLKEF